MAYDDKRSFTFWRSYYDAAKGLTDKQRLAFFDAVIQYGMDGEEIELEGVVKSMFILVKPTLSKSEKRAKAGAIGGASKCETNAKQTPSKSEAKSKQTLSKPQANTKQTASHISDDIEIDIDYIPPISPQGEDAPNNAPVFDGELGAAVAEWLAYKREKRQPYKPTGEKSLLAQIRNNADKHGAPAVIDAIRRSMAANYQGIVWDWLKSPNTAPAKKLQGLNYSQREYSADDLNSVFEGGP